MKDRQMFALLICLGIFSLFLVCPFETATANGFSLISKYNISPEEFSENLQSKIPSFDLSKLYKKQTLSFSRLHTQSAQSKILGGAVRKIFSDFSSYVVSSYGHFQAAVISLNNTNDLSNTNDGEKSLTPNNNILIAPELAAYENNNPVVNASVLIPATVQDLDELGKRFNNSLNKFVSDFQSRIENLQISLPASLTLISPASLPVVYSSNVTTGADRFSSNYLTVSHDATISGSLTVNSGGSFNTLGVSGDTSLTGNVTIGGTLNVTGDATLGRVAMSNASTTNLTVTSKLFGGDLSVGNATTTGLSVNGGTLLGSLVFGNATGTALTINGGVSFGSLGVTGLTNLVDLMAGNATTTGLTITGGASFNSITMSATSTMNGYVLCTSANGACGSNLTGTTGQMAYFSGTNTAVGTSTLFISTAGNVGIGTTSPGSFLSVHSSGNVYFGGALTVSGNSLFQNATTTGLTVNGGTQLGSLAVGNATSSLGLLSVLVSNATGNSGALNVHSATSSLLFVRSDGNVGIGTTNPNAKLEIVNTLSASTTDQLFLSNFAFATSTASRLTFRAQDISGAGTSTAAITGILTQNWTTGKGDLAFLTLRSGLLTEAMRITDAGNVGIASTSPSAVLSVNVSNIAGPIPALNITNATGSLMFIDSSGNVGIGTTTPAQKLSVAGTIESSSGGFKFPDGTTQTTATTATTTSPSFSVHKNGTNQTIVTTTWTKLTWSTEEWDTNNNFANDKFTPTIPGKYVLTTAAEWTANPENHVISIYKNGSAYKNTGMYIASISTASNWVDAIVDANGTTDYFEVYIYQASGVDKTLNGLSTYTYFQGHKLP